MKDLTAQDRIELIHRVMIHKDRHSDVAEQYRVKDFVVHDLVKKVRNDRDYLRSFIEQEDSKEDTKKTIIENATCMKQEDNKVFTSKDIQDKLSSDYDIDVT